MNNPQDLVVVRCTASHWLSGGGGHPGPAASGFSSARCRPLSPMSASALRWRHQYWSASNRGAIFGHQPLRILDNGAIEEYRSQNPHRRLTPDCPQADPNRSHLRRRRPAALLIGQPPDLGSAVGPAPASQTNGVPAHARGEPPFTNVKRVRRRGKDLPTLGRGLAVVRS